MKIEQEKTEITETDDGSSVASVFSCSISLAPAEFHANNNAPAASSDRGILDEFTHSRATYRTASLNILVLGML